MYIYIYILHIICIFFKLYPYFAGSYNPVEKQSGEAVLDIEFSL